MKILSCFATLFSFVSLSFQDEICCPGLRCFNDDPPFDHLPLPDCPDLDHDRVEDKTPNYNLFTTSNRGSSVEVTRDSIPSEYDGSKRTVFLIHGWTGDRDNAWSHDFKDQFFDHGFDYNVIVVGWGGGAQSIDYPWSASLTQVVGAESALVASNLISNGGGSASNMYCIGHSLGAHCCGFMGKNLRIGRVTGMDPAGPLFDGYSRQAGLDSNDADYVDTIVTDQGALGSDEHRGMASFFPNDGRDQPGCITSLCDHIAVLDYYWESIDPVCRFNARESCTDVSDIPGSCDDCADICQVMGLPSDQDRRTGMFRLTTNSDEPYCEG